MLNADLEEYEPLHTNGLLKKSRIKLQFFSECLQWNTPLPYWVQVSHDNPKKSYNSPDFYILDIFANKEPPSW